MLGYTIEYTVLITPVLMIGGYAIALLTARNSPVNRFTRAVVFLVDLCRMTATAGAPGVPHGPCRP